MSAPAVDAPAAASGAAMASAPMIGDLNGFLSNISFQVRLCSVHGVDPSLRGGQRLDVVRVRLGAQITQLDGPNLLKAPRPRSFNPLISCRADHGPLDRCVGTQGARSRSGPAGVG